MHRDGKVTLNYDDGDYKRLHLYNEQLYFENNEATISGNSRYVSKVPHVSDAEPIVLNQMDEHFGNKPFHKFQAQGFEQFVLVKAFKKEGETFLKTV